MFRNFIYLDTDKLYTYKRQIEGVNNPNIKTIKKTKNRGLEAQIATVSVKSQDELCTEAEVERDISFDYDRFEFALSSYEGEDYFDFVMNGEEYSFKTLPQMKIIRLQNSLIIPESFDIVAIIQQFKGVIFEQMEIEKNEDMQLMKSLFDNTSADIPILIQEDDITIFSKLNSKYLNVEYTDIENLSEDEVYILCRVIGVNAKEKVVVYDPLKDFVKLSRAIRRTIKADDNEIGLEKIAVSGPVLKVEIIAIYN